MNLQISYPNIVWLKKQNLPFLTYNNTEFLKPLGKFDPREKGEIDPLQDDIFLDIQRYQQYSIN
jgi:hypothetical protein